MRKIGIISPILDGSHFGALAQNLQVQLKALGYWSVFIRTPFDNKSSYLKPLSMNYFDGLIALKDRIPDSIVAAYTNNRRPVVGLGHQSPTYPTVYIDGITS